MHQLGYAPRQKQPLLTWAAFDYRVLAGRGSTPRSKRDRISVMSSKCLLLMSLSGETVLRFTRKLWRAVAANISADWTTAVRSGLPRVISTLMASRGRLALRARTRCLPCRTPTLRPTPTALRILMVPQTPTRRPRRSSPRSLPFSAMVAFNVRGPSWFFRSAVPSFRSVAFGATRRVPNST